MRFQSLLSFAAVLVAVVPALSQTPVEVEKGLKQRYEGKAILLRHFYRENQLHYTPDGELIGLGQAGPWTLSRIEIKRIKLTPSALVLEGNRVADYYDHETKAFVKMRTAKSVRIDVQVGTNGVGALDEAMKKVFLETSEELLTDLPSYWVAFLKGEGHGPSTRFPIANQPLAQRDFSQSPLPASPSNSGPPTPSNGSGLPPGVFKVGGKISAPRVTYSPDPSYEPLAQEAKFQGTTVLWVVVDEQGRAAEIRLSEPLGFGLDERAVDAVKTWRFQPAKRDGIPVAVQINIEVNFRLY